MDGFAEADAEFESRGAKGRRDHVSGRDTGARFDAGSRRLS